MADNTANLLLPYILAAQAQKHVTHNEALRLLDGVVQLSVLDRDLASPPGSPAEGARYIVSGSGSGAWAGWGGDVALWVDGAWARLPAGPGWLAWVQDEAALCVRIGATWVPLSMGATGTFSTSPGGATTGAAILEETLSGLSGASLVKQNQHGTHAGAIVVGTERIRVRGPGARATWKTIDILACSVTFSPHPQQIKAARRGYDD